MANWTTKILDRIFVVLGAIVCVQFPLFISQYQNQLIGHVTELKWQIDSMQNNALRSGKNLDRYIQKFIDHTDQDFSSQGEVMKLTKMRWEKLSFALVHLEQASTFTRPWVFLSYIQWDIVKTTLRAFEPGLPLTMEGIVYALLGMGLGSLLFCLLRFFWRFWFKPKPAES